MAQNYNYMGVSKPQAGKETELYHPYCQSHMNLTTSQPFAGAGKIPGGVSITAIYHSQPVHRNSTRSPIVYQYPYSCPSHFHYPIFFISKIIQATDPWKFAATTSVSLNSFCFTTSALIKFRIKFILAEATYSCQYYSNNSTHLWHSQRNWLA